uniref:Basal-body rod modification protein FlgD n=1 Tax=Rheinheimera sp. BAL341 TaxID=1708203 RepID=A0A486XXX6_9GAMM
MTTNVNNNPALNGMYWDNNSKVPQKNNDALTQEDFFALLTQQLAFQDPTKPVENDQMIAQMTNFTMADGIGSLNESFKGFAESMTSNQALQASSLVGRSVLTQSNEIVFTGESLSRGSIELDRPAGLMQVRIENERGELIRSFSVENPKTGKNEFVWDGSDVNDEAVAAGVYKIKVDVSYSDGKTASLPVNVYTPVGSVSMNGSGGGITLNLLGLGAVKLSDVLEVSYS